MRVLVSLLVLLAGGGFVYAALMLVVPVAPRISSVLAPYVPHSEDRAASSRRLSLAQTPLSRRAVEMTGRVAERWRILPAVEAALERADFSLRAAEALFFNIAGAVVAGLLGLFVWRAPLPALACLVVIGLAPLAFVKLAAGRRQRAFTSQLPDALRMLAGSLRSGRSLLQGLQVVAAEADAPVGDEFARVLSQVRLGRPTEDALDDVALRMASPDWQFAVTAVRIQRQVGGNLADLLSTVAETMIARQRLRGEVKALTAEGRVSAVVLGLLPVGLAMVMWVFDRQYLAVLFHDPVGQAMLIGAVGLAIVGFFWMKKTAEIEI